MTTPEVGQYHWRGGIYFKRLSDGSVHVESPEKKILFIVPPNEWASIIAHVSAKGETAEQYSAATEFHG